MSSSTALRKKTACYAGDVPLSRAAQVKLTLEKRALGASWVQHKPQEQIKGLTLEL